MKNYLKSITGFNAPNQFIEIATKFQNRFGSKEDAIEKISEYIGFDYVVDKNEVRGYEGVPFEAELPFATGSNGEHMGWLNIAPEIEDFDKPFITWVPMGCLVIYHGIDMNKVIEGKVKYLHEDNKYERIDMAFLNSIGINPENGKSIEQFINDESDKLEPIPIQIKKEWKYEMTMDGVGVYANSNSFAPNHKEFKEKKSPNEILEIAEIQQRNGYFASSIFLIKNGISKIQFDENEIRFLPKFYELAIKNYKGIGREEIAEIVRSEYKK